MGDKANEGTIDARLAAAYAIEATEIFGHKGDGGDDPPADEPPEGDEPSGDEPSDGEGEGEGEGEESEDDGDDSDDGDDGDDGIPDLDDLEAYAASRAKDRQERGKDSELAELRAEVAALKAGMSGPSFTADDFRKDPAAVLKAMGLSQRDALQVLTSRTLNPGTAPLEERLARLERDRLEEAERAKTQAQQARGQALAAAEAGFVAVTEAEDEDSGKAMFPELARLPADYRVALAKEAAIAYQKRGIVVTDHQLAAKLEKRLAQGRAPKKPAEDAGQATAAKGGEGKAGKRRKPKSMTGDLATGSTSTVPDTPEARLLKARALWEASE